jgi:hypothetical protein
MLASVLVATAVTQVPEVAAAPLVVLQVAAVLQVQ